MFDTSLPVLLRERASLQPDDTAYTFIDYEKDMDGVAESLTWLQLRRRVLNVARELRLCASPGDRAVILAPQSLDYIVAFLGALQAGIIAVPLSVPLGGVADERVDSVLRDAAPAVVLTTSAVVGHIASHITPQPGESAPAIIEVDLLNLDAPTQFDTGDDHHQTTAYLQYTSGSTRRPAGVMVSYENIQLNYDMTMRGFFQRSAGVTPPEHTIVLWLPFYHDLGLIMGVCTPVLEGCRAVLTSPVSFLQRPARWMQMLASYPDASSGAPNFAFELALRKITDDDMAGYDLGRVSTLISGAERVRPTPSTVLLSGSRASTFAAQRFGPPTGSPNQRCTLRPPPRANLRKSSISSPASSPSAQRNGAKAEPAQHLSAIRHWTHQPCGSSTRTPSPNVRREQPARSGCTAATFASAIGKNRKRPSTRSRR